MVRSDESDVTMDNTPQSPPPQSPADTTDPSHPLVYPEPTEDLKGGLSWGSLKYFGAGAIIASVTIGSGETVFASRGGAVFGYALLWCFVAGTIMKGVQVYTAARYITLTGQHPMSHWAFLPGPRNWVPVTIGLLSVVCFPFWQAALPIALGEHMNWVFQIDEGVEQQVAAEVVSGQHGVTAGDRQANPEITQADKADAVVSARLLTYKRFWGTGTILLVVALTCLQSYDFLEKVQVAIVGLLLACMFVAVFHANPDWLQALAGMVTIRIPTEYPSWVPAAEFRDRTPMVEIVTYLGAIGGGTYDYLGYIGCFREKHWGAIGTQRFVSGERPPMPLPIDLSRENIWRAKRWLIPARIDTGVGFLAVMVFTICFMLLGAKLLHTREIVPGNDELLKHQATFLTAMHPKLLYVYQLGIFTAIFGTIYGAYEIYARTAYECLLPLSSFVRRVPYAKFRLWVVFYCGSLGMLFMWVMQNPVAIITPAAIVGGVLTCGLWCLAMIWTDRHFLPKPLQMNWLLWALTWVSGIALTVFGVKAVYDEAVKFF